MNFLHDFWGFLTHHPYLIMTFMGGFTVFGLLISAEPKREDETVE